MWQLLQFIDDLFTSHSLELLFAKVKEIYCTFRKKLYFDILNIIGQNDALFLNGCKCKKCTNMSIDLGRINMIYYYYAGSECLF